MPRHALRAFLRLMLFAFLIGQLPPAVPPRPVVAQPLPPLVTVAAKPAEAAQASILSSPIDSNPAPSPNITPASIPAQAPTNQTPHAGDVEVLLPTWHAPDGQGGVWHYRPGSGWKRITVTDGSYNPDSWYWMGIVADPNNRNRWLLWGNNVNDSPTFLPGGTRVTSTNGEASPLWYTNDAGAHWQQVTLPVNNMVPAVVFADIWQKLSVAFEPTTPGKFFVGASVSHLAGYRTSRIWRGPSAGLAGINMGTTNDPDCFGGPGSAGIASLADGVNGEVVFSAAFDGYGGACDFKIARLAGSGTVSQTLDTDGFFLLDSVPDHPEALVGLGHGYDSLFYTTDYRTTAPTLRLSNVSGFFQLASISAATHGIYIGGRGASDGNSGILRVTGLPGTPQTSVAYPGAKVQAVRVDRQTRTTVAALHLTDQSTKEIYLSSDGINWQTIHGPQNGTTDVPQANLSTTLEVLGGGTVYRNDAGRCPCDDSPYYPVQRHIHTPYPVDTASGNFWTSAADLTVPSAGPALTWARMYASQAITDTSAVVGYGWQHAYGARLLTPGMPGGEPNTIVIVSALTNRQRFNSTSYAPHAGVLSKLALVSGSYVQTLQDQTKLAFDTGNGRLQWIRDPQGRQITLNYDAGTGRLTSVVDPADSSRTLALGYDGNGRIGTVTGGGLVIEYGYDGSGNLTNATLKDPSIPATIRSTTYAYQNVSNHLLTGITNAAGETETIAYDTHVPPRVSSQTLPGQQRTIQFGYLAATTIVTSTGADGRRDVTAYDYASDNTLLGVRNLTNPDPNKHQLVIAAGFDSNFHPIAVGDGNGNISRTIYTANGLPLTTTNALGQASYQYYDIKDNLIKAIDQLGVTSLYLYDSYSNLISQTLGITNTSSVRATTRYTYQYKHASGLWDTTAASATDSRLYEQISPDGVVMRYLYDDAGNHPLRVMTVILGPGTAAEQRTTYTYDGQGRVETVTSGATTALARTDKMIYNRDSTIRQTIQNFKGSGIYTSTRPDENISTTYGYDKLGRTIAITNTLGQVDVTRYNTRGQVEATARTISLPWSRDAQGQPIIPSFSAAIPDANLTTRYGYDGLGRTILVTETGILTGNVTINSTTGLPQYSAATARVTRTEYDDLSRPVTVTLNYDPSKPVDTLPDVNVRLLTYYDGAGNVIWQRDAYKRWTRTNYDALNRPVMVIRNYEDGNPLTGGPDTDIKTATQYDAGGRVAQTIDNYVDGIVQATDTITDRVTLYTYDSLNRMIAAKVNSAAGRTTPDFNRESLTQYDLATTRLTSQRTPEFLFGGAPTVRWTWMKQYDLVGRIQMVVQNCRTSGGSPTATNCANYDSSQRDRNIAIRSDYDLLGRVIATTQNYVNGSYSASAPDEDIKTRTAYDGLGRVTITTRNYIDGNHSDSAPAEDVSTRYGYDGLGRTVAVTETVSATQSATTRTSYDGLGRAISTTDPQGRITSMGSDASGVQRWIRLPDGRITIMQIDGLGRVVTTIQNYQDGSVSANEPADRDLIARVVYDKAGRQSQTIDVGGRITQYAYDNADRLIGVAENVIVGGCASLPAERQPCNVVTQYRYDRAGNRIAIVDARGYVRTFKYNAAGEQTDAIDPLGRTTSWQYDALGRLTQQIDPRQATASPPNAYNLTYSYDGLDRLTQTSAGSSATLSPISAQYDALGRRTSLADGSGASAFNYDALGRITQVQTTPSDQPMVTVGYGYNGRGDRTKLVYPDTTQLNYTYFKDGRLQQVTQGTSSPTTLASYTYDSVGRLAQVAPASASVTNYRYDGADRLLRVTTAVSGTTVAGFQYQNDRLGQRTVVTETLPLNPVLSATRIKTITFEGAALVDPVTGVDSVQQNPAAVALESTTPINGAYSARAATDNGYLREDLTTQLDEVFVTFYLRVDSIPSGASNLRIAQISNNTGTVGAPQLTTVGVLQLTTSGKLRLRNGSTTIGLDSATLQLGKVYRVGLHQKKGSGANGVLEAFLADSSNQYQFTSAFAASTSETFTSQTTRLNIGGTASGPLNIVLDDIALDSATWAPPAAPMSLMGAGGSAGMHSSDAGFPPAATEQPATNANAAFGRLPLAFMPNAGQTDSSVRYHVRGLGGNLFFRPGELVLALRTPARTTTPQQPDRGRRMQNRDVPPTVVRQRFIGANPTATITGTLRLPGTANFLLGNDPSKWRTNLRTYAGVAEQQIYPGIDLHTTGIDGELKRTFMLAPGADPARIRWRYDGASDVRVDDQGRLVVTLPAPANTLTDTVALSSTLTEQAPVAWQTIDEREVAVPIRFVVGTGGEVSFALGAYDATQPLTIDPTLTYSTYLGGSGNDMGYAIAVDSAGNSYITGETLSSNFPSVIPSGIRSMKDIFVSKLNPSGSALIYTTFLGGEADDRGFGIAVDSQGAAYITGATNSRFFPLQAPISTPFYSNTSCDRNPGATSCTGDAFVSKLSSAGNGLIYSTYVGGHGWDYANGIALDSAGNAYIVGTTASNDLPTVNAFQSSNAGQDVLLAKLNWNGSSLNYSYSTYFGGAAQDEGFAIAVDSQGGAFITGTGFQLPTTCKLAVTNVCTVFQPLANDAFVSKFTPSGSGLQSSVFIGGDQNETGRSLALDSAGNVYIGGETLSDDFPLLNAQQSSFGGGALDGFLTRLNWNGSSFSYGYSTYVGGSQADSVLAIAVSGNGTASATGSTESPNFPNSCLLMWNMCGVGGLPNGANVFVIQLSSSGSRNYSVYLDGSGNEYGRGIALDSSGQVYLTGDTSSSNFGTQSPIQGSNGGGTDAFVTKISTPTSPPDSRTISYRYDGLLRLIGASENPGQVYSYTYDLDGNRTDVLVNGIPTEPHRNYNAANQLVGWSYDEAGNLRSDGTWSYTYDALNRVRQASGLGQTQQYTYNGDGVLTMQAVPNTSTSTRYIQDLAAPLSQVLQSTPQGGSATSYLYGLTRLAAVSGTTKTWYVGDALGSVRRTLSSAGVPGTPISYDPWGQLEYGATPPTFGFTGELQDTTTGLVYLRARWYSSTKGTFTSRDLFQGIPELPYSLHPYQYGYSNPVLYTDPTGASVDRPNECDPLSEVWDPITGRCRSRTSGSGSHSGGDWGNQSSYGLVVPPPAAPPQGPVFPDGGMKFNPPVPASGPGGAPSAAPSVLGTIGTWCLRALGLVASVLLLQCSGPCPESQSQPQPQPQSQPTPPPTPTNEPENRATVQIQGHDITENNPGAVPDTNPGSGKWMLSYSWSQSTPISASDARRRLAILWKSLTPEQQHRRDGAY